MTQATAAQSPEIRGVGYAFLVKVFYVFAALALLSLAISLGGKWLGRSIALGGHTEDTTLREIVLGNDVVSVPSNMIRFPRQRQVGEASRLDLYMRWPQLDGYSNAARDEFNHAKGSRSIIFLSFEQRIMSRDMSGRFDPIYKAMLVQPGWQGPAGVTLYAFDPASGYLNETLAVSPALAGQHFVARCLEGDTAAESLAPCERDVHVGKGLSLTYRFPRELLGQWDALDAAVRATAEAMLRTGG